MHHECYPGPGEEGGKSMMLDVNANSLNE